MDAKHTPGPWFARKGDTFNPERKWGIVIPLDRETCEAVDGDASCYDANGNGRTVVIAEVFPTETDQGEADANLLAAAPDLLAALEGLFEHCAMVHKHWGEGSNAREADAAQASARAAIAKARP